MKKRTRVVWHNVFGAVFALLTVASQAAPKFEYGVKGGVLISNHEDAGAYSDSWTGIDFGAKLGYAVQPYLFVCGEIRYSPRGSVVPAIQERDANGMLASTYDAKTRIDCISIPMLAEVRFLKCLSLLCGPRVDYLLAENVYFGDDRVNTTKLGGIDFGMDYGIALRRHIRKGLAVSLELRNSPTLKPYMLSAPPPGPGDVYSRGGEEIKYSALAVLLGISIP